MVKILREWKKKKHGWNEKAGGLIFFFVFFCSVETCLFYIQVHDFVLGPIIRPELSEQMLARRKRQKTKETGDVPPLFLLLLLQQHQQHHIHPGSLADLELDPIVLLAITRTTKKLSAT